MTRLSTWTLVVLLFASLGGLGGCGDPEEGVPVTTGRKMARDGMSSGTHEGLAERPEAGIYEWGDAGPTRIRFEDLSKTCGIDYPNHSGRAGVKEFLLEAVGVGPAWLDYDGDGLLDLYVPDGDVFSNYTLDTYKEDGVEHPLLKPKAKKAEVFQDKLWRNNGDGTFTDVTRQAGIYDDRWSFGANVFDYDADGHPDIYVSNFGKNRLWLNSGNGSFEDIAEKVGAAGHPAAWSTCAAIGDVDGDGRLDIYIAQYADPAEEVERQRRELRLPFDTPIEAITGRSCRWRSIRAYCGPVGLLGQQDVMLRQRVDGTFEDVTEKWDLVSRVGKYGFTVLMYDYNQDGLIDIYVANDSEENFMWEQERDADGNIRFRDTSDTIGVKYGYNNSAQASMGASVADVNSDGYLDMFVTNFSHDYNNIYLLHTSGGKHATYWYKDRGLQVMGQAVFYDLSWGCGWHDFDNDADLDLYFANGHVYKEIDLFEKTGANYDQLNSLFECMDAARLGFREVGTKGQQNAPVGAKPPDLDAGPGMALEGCSRGCAFADFNNDGRVDIFVQNMNATPHLLLNSSKAGEWLKVVLKQPGLNRDALGATLYVTVDGKTSAVANVRCASFLGSDDPRLHVGLGAAKTCDIRVVWPGKDRVSTEFKGLTPGKLYVLDRETGKAVPQELKAFDPKSE
ncbi:MAG: CRTAC1 family protein [Planctomycetota bacterium]|nr:CRTAC1 family protein [Planctomycetota bacterium]